MDNFLTPDVSVIVATYNVQNYIERAIRSALDQQGVTIEVVMIDDVSSDDTVSIAARMNDPRVKIIRRTANGGPSLTRNEGIAAAAAPWLAVLDGDDAFAPGRLAQCLTRARELRADIIVDNITVQREADGASHTMFEPGDFGPQETLGLDTFIAGNSSFLGGTSLGYLKPIFSASFLRQHGLTYDPDIRIGEDYMLLAEALACGARCVVNQSAGYLYTVRKGSISHRLSLADIERIQKGDRKFLMRYKLDAAAQKAQMRRDSKLRNAYAFTILVDALKQKKLLTSLGIMARHPSAALCLWNPVWVRIEKLFKNNGSRNGGEQA